MDNLPAEIYYCILGHLSKRDIFSFSLVCKRVHDVANEIHNKTWIINNRKIIMVKNNTIPLDDNVYFKNSHLVRNLIFKSRGIKVGRRSITYPFLNEVEFLALLDHLPYIEEIDISKSIALRHFYIYFFSFANLQHIKKFKVLQFRPPFTYQSVNNYRQYISICFRFRDTLTNLFYQHENNLNELGQFKNLTLLDFNIQHGDGMIMFQILELLPQLTDFKLIKQNVFSPRVTPGLVEQSIETTENLSKNLRYLEITMPSLSIDFTKYLTCYLAEGFHTINIWIKRTSFYSWIEEVGMENALKLMKNLGQSEKGCIRFYQNDESRIRDYNNKLEIIRWLQLASAFNENKRNLCAVKIPGYGRLEKFCEFSSSNEKLTLRYEKRNLNTGIDEGLLYSAIGLISKFNLTSSSISTIGPETINRLELNLHAINIDDTLEFLKYLFTNFINLQYLKMHHYLEIRGCKDQNVYEPHGIQNNMTIVDFSSKVPDPEILNTISTYLPNIHTLVVGNLDRYPNITDLTTFKNLKRCYAITQHSSFDHYIYINFKYADRTEKLYYYNTKNQRDSIVCPMRDYNSSNDPYFTFICNNDTEVAVCLDRWRLSTFKADEFPGRHFYVYK